MCMNETRIYGKAVPVNEENIKAFWEQRAGMYEEKGDSTVILYGEQLSDALERQNSFTREVLIPQLNISGDSRILDVGCGVGRLARMLLPKCGLYYGVDFSESMVNTTRKVCERMKSDGCKADYKIEQLSLSEALQKTPDHYGGVFDCICFCGVCMYVNDEVLQESFCNIPALLGSRSAALFHEPVGIRKRLTLNNFYSGALSTLYNAIYRTPQEYLSLYQPLLNAGFSVESQGKIPDLDENYSDTYRWYAVLKR